METSFSDGSVNSLVFTTRLEAESNDNAEKPKILLHQTNPSVQKNYENKLDCI